MGPGNVRSVLLFVALAGAVGSHILPWWVVTQRGDRFESFPYYARDFGPAGAEKLYNDVIVSGVLLTVAAVALLVALVLASMQGRLRPIALPLRMLPTVVSILAGASALAYTATQWPTYLRPSTTFWDYVGPPYDRYSTAGVGWWIGAVCVVLLPAVVLVIEVVTRKHVAGVPRRRRRKAVRIEDPVT